MEKFFKVITACCLFVLCCGACSDDDAGSGDGDGKIYRTSLAEQNLERAIAMLDHALEGYFETGSTKMFRFYNPYTESRSNDEIGSIWMYTGSIEAVNAVMHALKAHKDAGDAALYNEHFDRYAEQLKRLYTGAGYFQGSFTLTSYTQTKEWSVYAVNRNDVIGGANVDGILNVYDDQMWMIREFMEAYHRTGDTGYLAEAEYLTEYVLDGWDTTLNSSGNENGGITWGPGYITKHACSNGPMVSPLVWLYEHYNGKSDQITERYIDTNGNRLTRTLSKSDYYLKYAKKVYDYHKDRFMTTSGVYGDMRGASGNGINYEVVNGVRYRAHNPETGLDQTAYPYNSGTMLSGGADLYRVTSETVYLRDIEALTNASFSSFMTKDEEHGYYTYDISGFRTWFNNVLMRGFADAVKYYDGAKEAVNSYQVTLDYAYDNYAYKNMLPTNLWVGWNRDSGKNDTEALFTFAFVAEYAALARYELEN